MLRRSYSVLLAFLLLGLLMILGWALLNVEGVEKSIEQARILLGEKEPDEAVRLLNRTQRSLGPGSAMDVRRDLHVLRAAALASSHLRNYDKAVEDLDFLLTEFKPEDFDPEDPRGFPFAVDRDGILRRRIHCLLLAGDASSSLGAARAFLQDHEGDQVVQDLAGQALQAIYQKSRVEILDKDLDLKLNHKQRTRLVAALDPWLFLRPDAPAVTRNFDALTGILNDSLDPMTAEETIGRFRSLRSDIQACSAYYQSALLGPEAVPASFQGYTGILLRTGDLDGAAALSWLYLQRFDKVDAAIAARRGMEAHLLMDDPLMARRVGRMWMTQEDPTEIDEDLEQDGNFARAYTWYALALYELGDDESLSLLAERLLPLFPISDRSIQSSVYWTIGLDHFRKKNWKDCETNLALFCKDPAVLFQPEYGLDLFLLAMRTRVDAAKAAKDYKGAQTVLREWSIARPDSPEPALELARLLADGLHLYRLASKECEAILAMPEHDGSHDKALTLLLQAQDAYLQPKGQDSKTLTLRLIQSRTPTYTDLPHPVLRYGIAIYASLQGVAPIFEANIRQFLEDYPQSNHARSLLAQHYYKTGRYDRALFETNSILQSQPDHALAALLHRKALEASKAPLETRLAYEREFLDRFSDRPEAAESMAELLLARGAWKDALDVSTKSLGARARPRELAWIRGRAEIARQEFPLALTHLLEVPKTSPHHDEALLLALRTALDHDVLDRVPAIVKLLLDDQVPPGTLFEAARLCAKESLPREVLSLLEPIFLGQDDASIEARNGSFFTLRARALLAMGKDKAAKDMLHRAVSFDDGREAGAYLVLLELFSGRKEVSQEIRSQLGALEGPPLTLLILDYRFGNFDAARKHLKAARLHGDYLEKVLLLALDSIEGAKSGKASVTTGVARLDGFARGHAERVLEALCFSADMAFQVRSDEAQASLQAWVSDGAESQVEQFLVDLVQAWRSELRGARIMARERLGALLRPSSGAPALQSFFLLTHKEFLRLAGDDYTFLTQPELAMYFSGLVTLLGADKLIDLGITQLALLGTGRMLVVNGKLEETRKVIKAAHMLAQKDLKIMDMLAEAQESTGHPDLAIETRLDRYGMLQGMDKVREMQALLVLREGIETDGKLADPAYGKALKRLRMAIIDYLEARPGPDHPPLGRATLIKVREYWDKQPDIVETLLVRCFMPYVNGEIAPGVDPDGLEVLLRFLLDKGHGQARNWLRGILLRDPSLVGLRLLEAEELARSGQPRKAIQALVHLQNLLPSEEATLALATHRARTGMGTRQEKTAILEVLRQEYPEHSKVQQGLLLYRLGRLDESLLLLDEVDEQDVDPRDQVRIDLVRLYARSVGEYAVIQRRMSETTAEVFEAGKVLASQLLSMIPEVAGAGR